MRLGSLHPAPCTLTILPTISLRQTLHPHLTAVHLSTSFPVSVIRPILLELAILHQLGRKHKSWQVEPQINNSKYYQCRSGNPSLLEGLGFLGARACAFWPMS